MNKEQIGMLEYPIVVRAQDSSILEESVYDFKQWLVDELVELDMLDSSMSYYVDQDLIERDFSHPYSYIKDEEQLLEEFNIEDLEIA